mmetsp:Transcript_31418/g.58608  ORF Transcript_31418/g.58608 Transcript_31418/m.58608 type:complete len:331 (+) Transcript_31418:734-1726(+)
MKLILDDDACISWPLLEGRLIESLTALCEGVVLRTQARLQDSLTAFSKALNLANFNGEDNQSGVKKNLASDELRWELQTHTVMSYLICCEFTACANLLHLMLQRFKSSPISTNTKRRRAVLLFLCGRYAEATGHIKQSRVLLKSAWRETEREPKEGEQAIDQSLLRLIRLRHAWASTAAKSGNQMAASALEEAKLTQATAASTGNATVEVYAMLVQGICFQRLNRALEARMIFRKSLKISNELQHKVATASSLSILGRSLLVDRRLIPPKGSKQEISNNAPASHTPSTIQFRLIYPCFGSSFWLQANQQTGRLGVKLERHFNLPCSWRHE